MGDVFDVFDIGWFEDEFCCDWCKEIRKDFNCKIWINWDLKGLLWFSLKFMDMIFVKCLCYDGFSFNWDGNG